MLCGSTHGRPRVSRVDCIELNNYEYKTYDDTFGIQIHKGSQLIYWVNDRIVYVEYFHKDLEKPRRVGDKYRVYSRAFEGTVESRKYHYSETDFDPDTEDEDRYNRPGLK